MVNMMQGLKINDLGGVNSYLLKSDAGYILIDTGFTSRRAALEKWLDDAGCRQGNLKLIIITHGDIDHAGNGAFIRNKYSARIVMHKDEAGVVEGGDMGMNRKAKPDRVSLIFRLLMAFGPFLFPPGKFEKFTPDVMVDDGKDLTEYGFDARIISIPGHSKGSVGILTPEGDLFCGDLLASFGKPGLHMLIDDMVAAKSSVEKLKKLGVKTIYPGHGKPFTMEQLKI
jgi:hydroxyacylglutathione hydrolase